MKIRLIVLGLGVLGLAILVLSFHQARARIVPPVARPCSNASLNGLYTYAFHAAGSAAIGRINFHGNGTFDDSITMNLGLGASATPVTGTYQVSTNCTFTSQFPDPLPPSVTPPPQGSHQSGIIAHGGKMLRVINADRGFILAFTAEKDE